MSTMACDSKKRRKTRCSQKPEASLITSHLPKERPQHEALTTESNAYSTGDTFLMSFEFRGSNMHSLRCIYRLMIRLTIVHPLVLIASLLYWEPIPLSIQCIHLCLQQSRTLDHMVLLLDERLRRLKLSFIVPWFEKSIADFSPGYPIQS